MPTIVFRGGPLDGTEAAFDADLGEYHTMGLSNKVQIGAGGGAMIVGADHAYRLKGDDGSGRLVFEYAGGEG